MYLIQRNRPRRSGYVDRAASPPMHPSYRWYVIYPAGEKSGQCILFSDPPPSRVQIEAV